MHVIGTHGKKDFLNFGHIRSNLKYNDTLNVPLMISLTLFYSCIIFIGHKLLKALIRIKTLKL